MTCPPAVERIVRSTSTMLPPYRPTSRRSLHPFLPRMTGAIRHSSHTTNKTAAQQSPTAQPARPEPLVRSANTAMPWWHTRWRETLCPVDRISRGLELPVGKKARRSADTRLPTARRISIAYVSHHGWPRHEPPPFRETTDRQAPRAAWRYAQDALDYRHSASSAHCPGAH